MTTLLRKEVRLLLPGTTIALLAAAVFAAWPDSANMPPAMRAARHLFLMIAYAVTIVALATAPIGREISGNTFAALLTHPTRRRTLWWIKALVLASALCLIWAAWRLALYINPSVIAAQHQDARNAVAIALIAVPVTAFAGGLASPLLFRQPGTTFWATIIAPVLVATVANLGASWILGDDNQDGLVILGALAAYTAGGVLWAYRLFLRAEDVDGEAHPVSTPHSLEGRSDLARFIWRTGATSSARHALIAKELRFLQPVFLLGALLASLHLALVVARVTTGGFRPNSALELVASGFWQLWLVVPLLIGGMALADERRYGTLQTQLCLPVQRRSGFLIKVGVGLFFAIALGGLAPIVIEGGRILPEWHDLKSTGDRHILAVAWLTLLQSLGPSGRVVAMLPAPALLFACGFFASTQTRSVLRALGLAIMLAVGVMLYLVSARSIEQPSAPMLWHGPLIHLITVPALVVTFGVLAYRNAAHIEFGSRQAIANVAVLVGVILAALVLTVAIYQRTWEWFIPLEPTHRPARITSGDIVHFGTTSAGALIVRHTDGRVWLQNEHRAAGRVSEASRDARPARPWTAVGQLPPDTWKEVIALAGLTIARNQAGELWCDAGTIEDDVTRRHPAARPGDIPLFRHAAAHTWTALAETRNLVLALRSDGTLWRVGQTIWSKANPHQPIVDTTSQRLDESTDWTGLRDAGWHVVLQRADGSCYRFPELGLARDGTVTLSFAGTPYSAIHISAEMAEPKPSLHTWSSGDPRISHLSVSIDAFGSLVTTPIPTNDRRPPKVRVEQPASGEARWTAVACSDDNLIALRADGTLWWWRFPRLNPSGEGVAAAARLGASADWVAIHPNARTATTLAADGSIWRWDTPSRLARETGRILLRPSRRPSLVVDRFGAVESGAD